MTEEQKQLIEKEAEKRFHALNRFGKKDFSDGAQWAMEQNQKEIDKRVEEQLLSMIRENSPKMISFMLCQMGNRVVESNAEVLTLTQDQTIDGQRYETKAVVKVKKIKSLVTNKQ